MNTHTQQIQDILNGLNWKTVDKLVKLLKLCNKNTSHTMFMAGNGGHFCEVQHYCQDGISYIINNGGIPIKTHALGSNIGVFSAIANDFGYEQSFVKELEVYGKKDDVLILMSGSGNSPNILEAAKWARNNGLYVIGFTGNNGGKLREFCGLEINIPSDNWSIIHALHSLIFHITLEEYLK